MERETVLMTGKTFSIGNVSVKASRKNVKNKKWVKVTDINMNS